LKTKLQDQKQFDLNGAITSTEVNETSQSNDPNLIFYGGHEDKQSNDPNVLWWGDHKDKQLNDPNSLFIYGGHEDKQSSDPNVLWWGDHKDKQPNDPNSLFIYGGQEDKQHNDPNLLSWGGHKDKQPNDPSDPNVLWWGGHKDKQPNDPFDPKVLWWGDHKDKQPNDPNQFPFDPKVLWWGGHKDKQLNDPFDPKVLWWGDHKDKQPNNPNQFPFDPKVLWWGDHKDSSKNLEDHPSSNLDHLEAFKLGFFNLDDLRVGNVMTLQFSVQKIPYFLSKKEVDSIPLSLSQLTRVLRLLSIPQDSPQAESMRKTLEHCEKAEIVKGETRMCVNSVESMLEFVGTIIGSEAKHDILTTSNPSPSAIPLQKYTILEVSHDINAPKWVACHPIPYPYAIYGCHYIATGSKVFKVSLVGDKNGDKMEALGMCHLDTSGWNPDHELFKTLGIKPGKNSSACHFFPVNHLLWVPLQPSKSTM